MRRSAGHQDRHGRVVQHCLGHAAEDELAQPGMAVSAHHQQVGSGVDSVAAEHVGHGTPAARQSPDGYPGAVPRKVGGGVGSWFGALVEDDVAASPSAPGAGAG